MEHNLAPDQHEETIRRAVLSIDPVTKAGWLQRIPIELVNGPGSRLALPPAPGERDIETERDGELHGTLFEDSLAIASKFGEMALGQIAFSKPGVAVGKAAKWAIRRTMSALHL